MTADDNRAAEGPDNVDETGAPSGGEAMDDNDAVWRLLSDLSEDDPVAPPAGLRAAVLAGARSEGANRPLPRADQLPAAGVPYLRQLIELSSLGPTLLARPAQEPVLGEWTATDVLAHLLAVDALAGAALGLPTPPETGSGADVLTRTASARSGPAGASLREALAVWRAQAAAIARHTAAVGEPGMARQVPYLGTVMAAGDVLLDRAFETWVHAEDLRTVLGRPALDPAPGDVHLMSDLGVRMLPGAWLSAGGDLDDELVHLVLTGPGGGAWRVGPRGAAALPDAGPAGWRPGLAAVVVMDGIDFCRLAGGRAEPHSVPHRVEGDRAAGAHVLAATALLARP